MDQFKQYNHLNFNEIRMNHYIGKGGTGEVYKATYRDKHVICKCIYAENYKQIENLFSDVNHEIKNNKYLKESDFICQLIGISWDEMNGTFYIILNDYDVKGDLNDFINQNQFWKKINSENEKDYIYKYSSEKWLYTMSRNTKVKITKQLCNAIEELHKRNIVHCDLKLHNLLYNSEKNQIIIIDFGASHYLGKLKSDSIGEEMGTEGYICQYFIDGYCSKKCDIYSLAVCILEIWCGAIWKDGESHRECRLELLSTMREIKKKEFGLYSELMKALSTDIKKRPYIQTFKKNIFKIL